MKSLQREPPQPNTQMIIIYKGLRSIVRFPTIDQTISDSSKTVDWSLYQNPLVKDSINFPPSYEILKSYYVQLIGSNLRETRHCWNVFLLALVQLSPRSGAVIFPWRHDSGPVVGNLGIFIQVRGRYRPPPPLTSS